MTQSRLGTTRRLAQDASVISAAERSIPQRSRRIKKPVRHLYFMQQNSDMPADGEDFPFTVLQDRTYHITGVNVYYDAATSFTLQLRYNGSLVGSSFTKSTTYPLVFSSPILYKDNNEITTYVSASSGVTNLVVVYTLLEI